MGEKENVQNRSDGWGPGPSSGSLKPGSRGLSSRHRSPPPPSSGSRKSRRQEEKRQRGQPPQQEHQLDFSPPIPGVRRGREALETLPNPMVTEGSGRRTPSGTGGIDHGHPDMGSRVMALDDTPNGNANKRRPSLLGRGPGGHVHQRPSPTDLGIGQDDMGGLGGAGPALGSIAAELEREAGRSEGAGMPTGPIRDMDDLQIMEAPSFADRPPTPSPPRPGARGAPSARPGQHSGDIPGRGEERDMGQIVSQGSAYRHPMGEVGDSRHRPSSRASQREQTSGPPQLPPSPPSRHQQHAVRPYPPPQQAYPYPPHYQHSPYRYPSDGTRPPTQDPYSHYNQGPPPQSQHPHPGYYPPPSGAYYGPHSGYGPPPSHTYGYPPHQVVDRWPDDSYPPPPQGYDRGIPQGQLSPPRGKGRKMRESEHEKYPGREDSGHGGNGGNGMSESQESEKTAMQSTPDRPQKQDGVDQTSKSHDVKSPPSKKRRTTAITPRTAATATSTPPRSTQSRPKRGGADASRTLLSSPPPYHSPAHPSFRREGHHQPERSPVYPQRSPVPLPHTPGGIGRAPTFTMDTPGGPGNLDPARLDEIFPPLGPSASFGMDPGPFETGDGGSKFSSQLEISRSASADGIFGGHQPNQTSAGAATSSDRRGPAGQAMRVPISRQHRGIGGEPERGGRSHADDIIQASPFTSFMGELSPLPGNSQGSPMSTYGRDPGKDYYGRGGSGGALGTEPHLRGPPVPIPSLTNKSGGNMDRMNPHPRLRASPMSASGSVRRRSDTQPLYRSPGPFRLQLGGVGMEQSEARRGMAGINSALRGSGHPPYSSTLDGGNTRGPPTHDYGSAGHSGYDFHGNVSAGGSTPSAAFNNEFRTPLKGGMPVPADGSVGNLSSSLGQVPTSGSSTAKLYGVFPGAMKTPAGAAVAAAGASAGKENETPKRRQPCNCKKSKCLKLYCECFAAELYCDGCNCQDCSNTKAYEAIRSKAIRDTKAKNPHAFKARIAVKTEAVGSSGGVGASGSPLPLGAHNMGCRCKKSACLKKYCECFEAGVMCGSKCKCVDCLNYVGSQALIDRRRKIKDHRGAELAMRSADEAWKAGQQSGQKMLSAQKGTAAKGTPTANMPSHSAYTSPPGTHQHTSSVGTGHMPAVGQYPHHQHMGVPPHMMHTSPHAHHPPSMYMPPHMMMGHHQAGPPSMGYSPMAVQPTPPAYSTQRQREGHDAGTGGSRISHSASRRSTAGGISTGSKRPASKGGSGKEGVLRSVGPSPYAVPPATPVAASISAPSSLATPHRTPHRTPSRRLNFDPIGSKRRRRVKPGSEEPVAQFFGRNLPPQSKTAALSVFSFLSNDDLYNTSLVCREWSKLSLDEELWNF